MTALAGEASAGARGSSGRRARTPRRGRVTERVGDLQGASARHVDKVPMAEDAEDKDQGRRLLSGVRGRDIARLAGERGAASARVEEGRVKASRQRDAGRRGHQGQEELGRSLLLGRCGETAPAGEGVHGRTRYKRTPRKDPLPRKKSIILLRLVNLV